MPFSEDQLVTWSHQGAVTNSASTYNSIKTCLDGINWNSDVSHDVYLQGSYRNTTNIRGNSDVDVVVEFQSVFYSNMSDLPPDKFREWNGHYIDSKYNLSSFKTAVVNGLKAYYGENAVTVGKRSIKITGDSGRLDADLICCAEYREYNDFSISNPIDYSKGIVFWETGTYKKVVNFPKLHFDNGVTKNRDTDGNYKPIIRIFKNMVSKLIAADELSKSSTPSYLIECLLYNIPDYSFKGGYSDMVFSILNTLNNMSDADLKKYVCQNYQRFLFGDTDQQWNITNCRLFIAKAIEYWNEE